MCIRDSYYGVDIGMGSYGCFVNGLFPRGCSIGAYCSIAQNVKYLSANHPINYACMHPIFYNSAVSVGVKDVPRSKIEIGNDVWIGYGTIILSGCTKIGNGVVIGAGSIVTRDIPAYSIVCGSPARVIRKRFDDETIEIIEQSKWWELPGDELLKAYGYIDNPREFAKYIQSSVRKKLN